MITITKAGTTDADDRQAGGDDDHDGHQGAFLEDMVC
jgi:hypothetical protein